MVPGLALDRLEAREFRKLIGGRLDQRQLALLRQRQQQILVGQQYDLAVAVASALPLALAVFEADAREDAAIEAEGVTLVNNGIAVVWLQSGRRPTLLDTPSGVAVRDRDAAQADRCHSGAAAEQDVAARDH